MRLVRVIAIASFASWSIFAADQYSVSHSMTLVGFIRVGASDAQSLVVLKEKRSGKTLFLRRFEIIPGTPFRLLRFERDHVLLQSPGGREVLRMESSFGREGEEPSLAELESVPEISVNPNSWQQLLQKKADEVPDEADEMTESPNLTRQVEWQPKNKSKGRDESELPVRSKDALPEPQDPSEIVTWEPSPELTDTCTDCVK